MTDQEYKQTELASLRQSLAAHNAAFDASPRPRPDYVVSSYCYITGQLAAAIAELERELGIRQEVTK